MPIQDAVKISRLTIENRSGQAAPPLRDGLCRVGARLRARRERAVHRDRGRLAHRAHCSPGTPGTQSSAIASPSRTSAGRQTAWTGDRTEFLGKNGTPDHPALLERGDRPSGRVGAGLDPCAALQTSIELPPGGRAEVVFFLGQAATVDEARALVTRYRDLDLDLVFKAVTTQWDDIAGAVQVKTPDRSMDLMLNRWLLYQTLACRVWARSAFYQAGGAYGFRDQLQDVMALTVAARGLAREHLLRAAARQFAEGDVQHWWHPPSGRGVRTRIADDCVWLPYAVAHYVEVTGDAAVLDEVVPFLAGPALADGSGRRLFPADGLLGARHALRALRPRRWTCGLAVGAHGLPLIGRGGLERWHESGRPRGPRARASGSGGFSTRRCGSSRAWPRPAASTRAPRAWRAHVGALKAALEQHGWDGDWYRRAYFDDGTPLGSAANAECRIDSIAQSWAVISGAGEPSRAARAMAAVEEYLVRRGQELVLLFTPPFDGRGPDPGYITGYPPGIRENGGQYTHAAIWSVMAFAALGDGDKANELFSILNPINRASTRAGVHRYKVEPYVAPADVYAEPPHVGRGGWTWYTGSAGWMYRAGIEWLLGFRLRGAILSIDPCIPRAWRGFEIAFRYHGSRYEIVVMNPGGVSRGVPSMEVDGTRLPSAARP